MTDFLVLSRDLDGGLREIAAATTFHPGHRLTQVKVMLMPNYRVNGPDTARPVAVGGTLVSWMRDVVTQEGLLASGQYGYDTVIDDETGLEVARALQELLDMCNSAMPDVQGGSTMEYYTVANLIADLDNGTLGLTLSSPVGYQLMAGTSLGWEGDAAEQANDQATERTS